MADFIPQSWAAFAEWLDNFATQLPSVAAKYNLTASLPTVAADNAWVQYWVQAKFNAKQQEKQLTDFVDIMTGGKEGDAQPTVPAWELPADPPAQVNPGIKQRIRAFVRQIKANPNYTKADGELLGIISPDEGDISPDNYTPDVKFHSLSNFALEADFRLYGLDALRIEFRHKGGAWQLAAILTSSPGVFNVIPQTAGVAEQIELRCVFTVKNQNYGNFSPIYTAVIQP